MYGLSNLLSVLWYTVAGWFGVGRDRAHAVTLFNGDERLQAPTAEVACGSVDDEDANLGGLSLDVDVRYTHPHGWGFDTRN